jgi:hypothetical protein
MEHQQENEDIQVEETTTAVVVHGSPPANPLEAIVNWVAKTLLPHSPLLTSVPSYHKEDETETQLTAITLFFDEITQCCVAVLSQPAHGVCNVYFQCRIEQGTARKHSELYYVLDDFVRPQYTLIRHALQPHPVHIAVGALENSDEAQKATLEQKRYEIQQRRHCLSKYKTSLQPQAQTQDISKSLLPKVFDVALLYRLVDDLDFVSLYCLGQTSLVFRSIAIRAIRQKRMTLQLEIAPYVDGSKELGYSRLIRTDESNLVQHMESDQSVIYRKVPSIQLEYYCHPTREIDKSSSSSSLLSSSSSRHTYRPTTTATIDDDDIANTRMFTWSCQEVALAQIHSWWVAECEYVGQKLVVQWRNASSSGSNQQQHHHHHQSNNTATFAMDSIITLDRIRLEAGPRRGVGTWRGSNGATITLNVVESQTRALDTISLQYSGKAEVKEVHVPFMVLVRAQAKVQWPQLSAQLTKVQQHRPLLTHELAYGKLVQSLCKSKES